jgi:transcriptional regulator with XRE-family HTH domain
MGNYNSITSKLIKLREQSGLTQADVANKLGISRQRWILVEKGERDLSTEELETLAALFGVDAADFFEEIPDVDKFRQMYFACIKFASDERGGVPKTKLAKLLYLADFTKYHKDLEPMSGVKYRRMEFGPVADIFFSITEDLFDGGKIKITPMDQALIISSNTRDQSFDKLDAKELALIEEICKLWKNKRTAEIVNFTHEQKPWKMCRDGEYIPYSLIIQEDPNHVYQPIAG